VIRPHSMKKASAPTADVSLRTVKFLIISTVCKQLLAPPEHEHPYAAAVDLLLFREISRLARKNPRSPGGSLNGWNTSSETTS
jgi:hypothetical protein